MDDVNSSRRTWTQILAEPHPTITDTQQRRSVTVLAWTTLSLVLLTLVAVIAYFVISRTVVTISLVAEGVFLVVYLLSRSRWPTVASWVLISGMSFAIFYMLLSASGSSGGLVWVMFPILLSAVLLSSRMTMGVMVVNLVIAILVVIINPAMGFDVATTPLLVIAFVGALSFGAKYIREQDTQRLESQAQALIISQQRYRELFDGVPIGLYQIDLSGKILRANPALAKLLGYPDVDALVGENLHGFFFDTERQRQRRDLLQNEGALARFEWRVRLPSSESIWVAESTHAITDDLGQPMFYQGTIEDITQRRKAREEMLRQKQYWEALIMHSPVAIVTLDLAHRINSINSAFERLFGYTHEQVVGHKLDDLIVPDADKDLATDLTGNVISGKAIQVTAQRRRRDGTLVDVEVVGTPVVLDGQQVGALAIYQDISQRKQAERELIGRQARLEMLNNVSLYVAEMTDLADIMSTIVEYARWVADADLAVIAGLDLSSGKVDQVYSANYPMQDVPIGTEIVGQGILGMVLRGEIVHSADVTQHPNYIGYPGWHPKLRACLGVPVKYGERIFAVMLLGNMEPGKEFTENDREVILTLSHLAAVAMHTAHQFEELNKAIGFQKKILETAATAVFTINTDLRITSINQAFTQITGYKEAEVIGESCLMLQGDPCIHGCGLYNLERTQPIYQRECEVTTKSGERLTIIKNADTIRNERGQVVGGIESFTDVTALIVARREAEAASKAKGEFLANMSHELRTPLNAILGFVQVLERSSIFPAEHQQDLNIIHRSSENLLELINDILDMSKIDAGRITLDPTDFDLHGTLENIVSMLNVRAEKKGLRLTLDCAPDVPRFINSDERKLRQVLINLIGNAVKFTDQGGIALRVAVAGASDDDDDKLNSGQAHLHFEVQDTGVGIAPEELDVLFEVFTQTSSGKKSKEGTGLGLPISREFVRMMGGELVVQSQVGKGSTFAFDVRYEPATAAPEVTKQITRRVTGLEAGQSEYRILIVDDREENRMLVRRLLEEVGFSVLEAADGKQAVDIHAQYHPHLIFMDMRMPVMDGYEATQQIKATLAGQSTVIVALTASVLEMNRAVSLSAGCDDFVRKPFRDADILAVIEKHLNVCYTYANQELIEERGDGAPVGSVMTTETMVGLPAEWQAKLRDATNRARGDLVLELANSIERNHPQIARRLSQLVDEFRFDEILALLPPS